MSNRMSVLSRRLGRFAGGFSFATVAFFSIGLYAAANTKGQVVFLFEGLVLVCLFASFFLWLAHGFAWAMIPEKSAEEKKPAEALKPADALKPPEAMKAMKPAEALNPPAAVKPEVAIRPAEPLRLGAEPVETCRGEEKPAEEKVIAPEEDPPGAQYTITGRRIH